MAVVRSFENYCRSSFIAAHRAYQPWKIAWPGQIGTHGSSKSFIMEAHGALAQPAVELVRTLADRNAPRRAGLRGGVATAVTSTSSRSLVAHKAPIKNDLKQVLSKAVQRCHASSLSLSLMMMFAIAQKNPT